jgi:hypothetical protein
MISAMRQLLLISIPEFDQFGPLFDSLKLGEYLAH